MQREESPKKSPKPRRPQARASGPLGPARPPSDRPAQIAGEIRRALQSELSRGLNDPRVQGMVSITEVTLAPDYSVARVQISVLPEDRAPLTLSGLRAGAGFLRRKVMDETRISRVPRLEFELDDRIKRQAALDAAIRGPGVGDAEAGSSAPPAAPAPRRRGRMGDKSVGEKNQENPRDEG
jgi:ribosome-binding factor A